VTWLARGLGTVDLSASIGVTVETTVPFRAWRYNQGTAGDLGRLIAPPYDVIGPELQAELYSRSPYNVVRVDLGMAVPGDSETDNQYTRAAQQLAAWKGSGILVRDPEPSVTFVEETFHGPDGRDRTRRGFLALVKLRPFEDGVVFPHEFTLSGPKEDRFRLMRATNMSLSPVFLLYDLPGDDITAAWASCVGSGSTGTSVSDEAGTVTRVWPTSDPALLELMNGRLTAQPLIIADGHHRYETALRYRQLRLDTDGRASVEGSCTPAFDYALAYFSNMADPGLAIYGTHRLLSGLPPDRVAALPTMLGDAFAVEPLSLDSDAAPELIAAYLNAHSDGGAFGLCGPGLNGVYGLRLTDPEAVRAAVPGHSAAYQGLDVVILHSLIFEKLLGMTSEDQAAQKNLTYFKDPREAFSRLGTGEFQAGFFLNPTRFDQIREVALGGERMPQKSTFFYPKLPTGLVFHDLDGYV
jgi:uncharacterized protein (DUF1015 family)